MGFKSFFGLLDVTRTTRQQAKAFTKVRPVFPHGTKPWRY